MKDSIIEKAAKDYIANQLDQNQDWLRCITDSWIYDAENWFLNILEKLKEESEKNDLSVSKIIQQIIQNHYKKM